MIRGNFDPKGTARPRFLPTRKREEPYNLREQTALLSPRYGPIVDYRPISPASQLRDIGYDAVPALIEGCEDNRFTRARTLAVGSPPGLLPVGFCCHEILREITGQNFKDKASARLWWQEFQNKGEKQILIDGTEAGDASSPAVAERLLKKYPDAALASIIKGAQRSKNGSVRSQLVRIVAKLKGDEAVRFLCDESKGPWFESRYTAANALLACGRDEGVLAMIQEWNDIPLAQDLRIEHWGITDFLAWCGKPEAIAALVKNLRQRDAGVRSIVIMAFQQPPHSADPDPKPMPDAITKAADQLLVNELDDHDRGVKFIPSGAVKNPRICDLSAYVLTKRWGRTEQFDESDSEKTLDDRIEALKADWRKRTETKP